MTDDLENLTQIILKDLISVQEGIRKSYKKAHRVYGLVGQLLNAERRKRKIKTRVLATFLKTNVKALQYKAYNDHIKSPEFVVSYLNALRALSSTEKVCKK